MSVERRIKEKAKKVEVLRDKLGAIQQKRAELEQAMKEIEELESDLREEIYKVEDYFIEHNASLQIRPLEIIKGVNIEVLIAHKGNTVFAVFGGLVTSAKVHPEDEYVPEVGEAIAVQRLVNKILELNYGAKF